MLLLQYLVINKKLIFINNKIYCWIIVFLNIKGNKIIKIQRNKLWRKKIQKKKVGKKKGDKCIKGIIICLKERKSEILFSKLDFKFKNKKLIKKILSYQPAKKEKLKLES